MGSYFDDTGYAATLSQGDRLTREEFRDQMSRRIVAGITIWDRDQGRPAQASPFDPRKRDLKMEWNPFAWADSSFRDKLEKDDAGYGGVLDYIYDNLDEAYRTQGFVDNADIRNVLRGALQDGEAGLVFIHSETIAEFNKKIEYDTRVVRNWIDETVRATLSAEGYSEADVNRAIWQLAHDDSTQNFVYDSTNYGPQQLTEAAQEYFGATNVVATAPPQSPVATSARYGQQNQMDIGYMAGDDLRQAFYETGDYNAFMQFVQTQELEWERTYGDMTPAELAANPDLVIPDRAKFQVWDSRPMPEYQFKDAYNWSEYIRLPFELPRELVANISKKWELSGLYGRYNNGVTPMVTGDPADPNFQRVWRLVGAEAFVADTPLWTYSDNALQSRIARVEGLIERFDATNVDQQIDSIIYNVLGRRGTFTEIADMRDSIALLDQDVSEMELESDIEDRLASLESQGLTGSLQTQIAARITNQFAPEAKRQRLFSSAMNFGGFKTQSPVDEPFQPAATITGETGFGGFGN